MQYELVNELLDCAEEGYRMHLFKQSRAQELVERFRTDFLTERAMANMARQLLFAVIHIVVRSQNDPPPRTKKTRMRVDAGPLDAPG